MIIFKDMFQEQLPELYAHFKAVSFPISLHCIEWFTTCFLTCFDLEHALKVLDVFLLDFSDFLLRLGLAVLILMEEQLHLSELPLETLMQVCVRVCVCVCVCACVCVPFRLSLMWLVVATCVLLLLIAFAYCFFFCFCLVVRRCSSQACIS